MEIKLRLFLYNSDSNYRKVKKKLDRLGVKYDTEVVGRLTNGGVKIFLECYVNESDHLYPSIANIYKKYKLICI